MTRLAGALAVLACIAATGADAGEFRRWPSGSEAAIIDRHPWSDGLTAPVHDDAFVFADVDRNLSLSSETVAIATRFDVELLSRRRSDPPGSGPSAARADARVAWCFDRFVAVGQDGRAYASLDLARGRSGPTSLAENPERDPSVLAMAAER